MAWTTAGRPRGDVKLGIAGSYDLVGVPGSCSYAAKAHQGSSARLSHLHPIVDLGRTMGRERTPDIAR